jgi:hypothetical protein
MSDAKTPRAELPALLGARAVAARYGLKDLPAARKLMRAAGGFRAAGRMVVRADDLDAYERDRAAAARGASASAPRAGRRAQPTHPPQADLAPDWWREHEVGD